MNKRKIANTLKGLFKLILLFLIFVGVIFIGLTIKNKEVKLIFKKEEITYSTLHKYYHNYDSYRSGLPSRVEIQDEIIERNFEESIMYSGILMLFVLVFLIIRWTYKFIKKYAD